MSFMARRKRRVKQPSRDINVLVGGIEQFGAQRYDPDLAALDAGSMIVSKGRLRTGAGAAPVVAYGQRLFPQLTTRFQNFPRLRRLLKR